MSEDLEKIDEILNNTIRPAMQADGGDLELIGYDEEKKILTIKYQGACGSCPMSTMGTLTAIKEILAKQFDPAIDVKPL